jgi:hypothetical protein
MMFCKIISVVVGSFCPVHAQLLVRGLVAKPVSSHVPSFGTALLNVGVNETVRGGVIRFERRSVLRMAQSM